MRQRCEHSLSNWQFSIHTLLLQFLIHCKNRGSMVIFVANAKLLTYLFKSTVVKKKSWLQIASSLSKLTEHLANYMTYMKLMFELHGTIICLCQSTDWHFFMKMTSRSLQLYLHLKVRSHFLIFIVAKDILNKYESGITREWCLLVLTWDNKP